MLRLPCSHRIDRKKSILKGNCRPLILDTSLNMAILSIFPAIGEPGGMWSIVFISMNYICGVADDFCGETAW